MKYVINSWCSATESRNGSANDLFSLVGLINHICMREVQRDIMQFKSQDLFLVNHTSVIFRAQIIREC